MFFTVSMIAIIWLNLLHCIASDKNETFHLLNLDTGDEIFTNNSYSSISDNFDTLDYNNFEPLFGPEFSFDPSQFIDFAQLSEIEDISSKESKREADQITDTSYPGFSHSYDFIGHTNSESSLGSDMDSYRNVWREGNGEIKTNDDKVRHLSIRDAESRTSSPPNLNSDDIVTYMHFPHSQQNAIPIYFDQFTLSSDDTSGQHGAAEQSNIDNHRGNTGGESETVAESDTSYLPKSNTSNVIAYIHYPGLQNPIPIYFSSDDTSSQHGNAEQSNIDNKHFSDGLNILDHRGNTDGKSEADKRNYNCHYRGCAMITKNYNEYLIHKKTHGQPFIYECKEPGCGRTFDHKSSFVSHKQTHQPKQYGDRDKLFSRKNALQFHNMYYGSPHKRSFECLYPGCTMTTKSLNEYRAHGKTHGQPFIYECKVPGCGRTYDIVGSLYSHKQTHEPHPSCECCGKLFATRKLLNCHKKFCPTTLREQSYECYYPGCAVIAKGYNEYLAHRKTHGQPFIYECKVPGCGQTFDCIPSFCAHKQTHQTHLQCAYCGKLFSSVTTLKSHKKLCSKAPR
ncbi:Uncharacterized protein BM_BM17662 [Brugia malayi]|uniref:C2H2-type domain-containing protein n=1 Tax=Brugia malayi TaxID=6279 RepID=A0A4E9FKB3_BRUMA|nr:Uncharacterized protein BM_BM17662 [Brugia malayi]VIO96966.1 Uncharacterized protein BM_BM17662 [Brugia malayi]